MKKVLFLLDTIKEIALVPRTKKQLNRNEKNKSYFLFTGRIVRRRWQNDGNLQQESNNIVVCTLKYDCEKKTGKNNSNLSDI